MTIHPDIERVALLGWRVYPSSRYSKAGCIKRGTDLATHDLDQLERWAHQFPNANWRVVFGGSGIWGLDIDVPSDNHKDDGVAALKKLVAKHSPLPARPTSRSGGGGYCLFFKHTNERIAGKTGTPVPGIDPRRGRLSVTIPPSIHVTTGRAYSWLIAPWEVSPPVAPGWLLRLVQPPPEPERPPDPIVTHDAALNRLYRAASTVADTMEGGRNDTLNRKSFEVGRIIASGLIGEQQAVEALYSAARACGLPHHEAKATILSGLRSGVRHG